MFTWRSPIEFVDSSQVSQLNLRAEPVFNLHIGRVRRSLLSQTDQLTFILHIIHYPKRFQSYAKTLEAGAVKQCMMIKEPSWVGAKPTLRNTSCIGFIRIRQSRLSQTLVLIFY